VSRRPTGQPAAVKIMCMQTAMATCTVVMTMAPGSNATKATGLTARLTGDQVLNAITSHDHGVLPVRVLTRAPVEDPAVLEEEVAGGDRGHFTSRIIGNARTLLLSLVTIFRHIGDESPVICI
jgi:hypothetical protein